MRQCMARPCVAGFLLECRPCPDLGLLVVTGLFQAEGVHALEVAPTRPLGRPCAQHSGYDAQEVFALSEKEVQVLSDLESQEVARVVKEGSLEVVRGIVPLA